MTDEGGIINNIGGWWLVVNLFWFLICTFVLIYLKLSGNFTGALTFYDNLRNLPWILIAVSIIVYIPTKIAIMPFGFNDPNTFIAQKFLGYNGAFVACLVISLILGSVFFTSTAQQKGVGWIPSPKLITTGVSSFQALSTDTREFFSGRDAVGTAVSDSFIPEFIEDPTFILSLMLIWVALRYGLVALGVPDSVANICGFAFWVIVSSISFPFIAHSWAYQEAEPAYIKAFIFVFVNAIVTGLTGFPLPFLICHIANNWASTWYSIVGYGVVLPPILAGYLLYYKPKGLNTLKAKLFKGNMNTLPKFGSLLVISLLGVLLFSSAVYAFDWSWLNPTNWFKAATNSTAKLTLANNCQILTPVWQYWICQYQPLASPPSYIFQIPKSSSFLADTISATPDQLSCNKADVYNQGSQSCILRMTASNAVHGVYYTKNAASCSQTQTLGGNLCTGTQITTGTTVSMAKGDTLCICAQRDNVIFVAQDASATFELSYTQQYLALKTWTGQDIVNPYLGKGCGIQAVLNSNDWATLPKDAKISLNPGETQNFIEIYTSQPVTGNYFASSKYGDVVCNYNQGTGTAMIYNLVENTPATPSSSGSYNAQNGQCYYTVANSGTSVPCCPGEPAPSGGSVCTADFTWGSVDKGTCVRGGLADPRLCPGGGGDFCDITTHTHYSPATCDANTGSCLQTKTTAACCPGQGCAGDQYCDTNTYTCQKKPNATQACDFGCCQNSPLYQDKACSSGLKCCTDATGTGSCKTSCTGVPCLFECCSANDPDGYLQKPCVSGTCDKHICTTSPTDCNAKCEDVKFAGLSLGFKNPMCSAGCWIKDKMANLIVALLLIILCSLVGGVASKSGIGLGIGFLVGVVLAAVTIFYSLYIGVAFLIVAIVGLIFVVAEGA